MKDKRFIETDYHQHLYQRRIEAINAKLVGLKEQREKIEEKINEWWDIVSPFLDGELDNLDESDIDYKLIDKIVPKVPSLSEVIANSGVGSVKGIVDSFDVVMGIAVAENGVDQIYRDLAAHMLGDVVGRRIANSKSPRIFQFFHQCLSNNYNLIEALEDSLINECSKPDINEFWIAELAKEPELQTYIDRFQRDTSVEYLEKEIESWNENQNPFAVWPRSNHKIFDWPSGFQFQRFSILKQLDRNAWRDMFERLPLPDIQFWALWGMQEEPDEIVREIDGASSIFDEHGRWNRNLLVVHIAQMIVTYSEVLYDALKRVVEYPTFPPEHKCEVAQNAHVELREKELPEWLKRTFTQLLNRDDGIIIGIELYVYLLNKLLGEIGRNRYKEEESIALIGLNVLSECLLEHGVDFAQIREQWKKQKEWKKNEERSGQYFRPSGLHFVLTSIVFAIEFEKKSKGIPKEEDYQPLLIDDPVQYWEWIAELLLDRDHGFSSIFSDENTRSRQIVENHFGRVLLSLDHPIIALKEAWNSLKEQRKSAINYKKDDFEADRSSKMLVYIVFGAISGFIGNRQEDLETTIEGLWGEIIGFIQSMYLRQRIDNEHTWRNIYVLAITILGVQYPAGYPILDKAVAFLSNDESFQEEVGKLMLANGWEEEDIKELIKNNCLTSK